MSTYLVDKMATNFHLILKNAIRICRMIKLMCSLGPFTSRPGCSVDDFRNRAEKCMKVCNSTATVIRCTMLVTTIFINLTGRLQGMV